MIIALPSGSLDAVVACLIYPELLHRIALEASNIIVVELIVRACLIVWLVFDVLELAQSALG